MAQYYSTSADSGFSTCFHNVCDIHTYKVVINTYLLYSSFLVFQGHNAELWAQHVSHIMAQLATGAICGTYTRVTIKVTGKISITCNQLVLLSWHAALPQSHAAP
jgi:hypothetical protein